MHDAENEKHVRCSTYNRRKEKRETKNHGGHDGRWLSSSASAPAAARVRGGGCRRSELRHQNATWNVCAFGGNPWSVRTTA